MTEPVAYKPPYNIPNHERRKMLLPLIAAIVSRPDAHGRGSWSVIDEADMIVRDLLSRYPEY